jgi:hypothetical protein
MEVLLLPGSKPSIIGFIIPKVQTIDNNVAGNGCGAKIPGSSHEPGIYQNTIKVPFWLSGNDPLRVSGYEGAKPGGVVRAT